MAGESEQAQFFAVSEVVTHPQFDFFQSRYDVALIRLNTNATINDFLRTICLPSEQDQTDFPDGTMGMVSSWNNDGMSEPIENVFSFFLSFFFFFFFFCISGHVLAKNFSKFFEYLEHKRIKVYCFYF